MQGISLPVIELLFSSKNNNQIQKTNCRHLSSSLAFSYFSFHFIVYSVMRTRLNLSLGEKSVRMEDRGKLRW